MFWVIVGVVLLLVLTAAWLWDRRHDPGHTARDEAVARAQSDPVVRWINGGGGGLGI